MALVLGWKESVVDLLLSSGSANDHQAAAKQLQQRVAQEETGTIMKKAQKDTRGDYF